MTRNKTICGSCSRPLTEMEMNNADKKLAEFCHECIEAAVHSLADKGEVKITGDRIQLTKKGIATARRGK